MAAENTISRVKPSLDAEEQGAGGGGLKCKHNNVKERERERGAHVGLGRLGAKIFSTYLLWPG